MGIKGVFWGECESNSTGGYFVDIVCDGNHEGECGSNNPVCSFENLVSDNKSKEKCKEIALAKSKELNVPLASDFEEPYYL